VSRLTAWAVLLAAASLIYSLAFTTFEQFAGRWESTETGGLSEVTVQCPAPLAVLLLDAEPPEERDRGACDLPSRTLALEAMVVALGTGLVVWRPLTRRRPEQIEPLSRKLGRPNASPRG
jgi:hypothetical protein